jgi:hypothetical protein
MYGLKPVPFNRIVLLNESQIAEKQILHCVQDDKALGQMAMSRSGAIDGVFNPPGR